ncbi:MAG: hypothetical protein ACUVTD_02465 [Nitrososphaerales archaeon]
MDIVFIFALIPIFVSLLLPILFLRDIRFVVFWLIVDALVAWHAASLISSFTYEQWVIASTSFEVYPFFEALQVATIPGLCLAGVAILMFILYLISLYVVFRGLRKEPEPQVPLLWFPYESSEPRPPAQISQTSKEVIRRLIESQQEVDEDE